MTYDAQGNRIARRDFNGRTTTHAYDLMNRLVRTTPDPAFGEPDVRFTYTPTGRRASMTDASGTTSYAYDARDRLLEKATPAGTLSYTYDAQGNVARIRSSNAGGVDTSYAWDSAGQLASVTDNRGTPAVTVVAYTPTGQPSTVRHPTGVEVGYTRDALDRATSLLWRLGSGGGAPLASYTYALGPAGHRLSVTESSGRRASYGYDATHRLTAEEITGAPAAGNGRLGYVLDPVGNRLERTSTLAALPPATYAYDANDRLLDDSWDGNGNTTRTGSTTFTYDHADRLVTKNGGEARFVYDGDGVLVGKTTGGVTTRYLVDHLNPSGLSQILEEVVGGAPQVVYTHGSMLVSQSRRGAGGGGFTTSYYGYDAHGNVTFLTDATGAVTDTYTYDAWGNLLAASGAGTANVYLYQGQRFEPELGMYQLRARYYEPGRGRFVTGDLVIGDPRSPLSWNRYLYANADPIGFADPLGRAAIAYDRLSEFGLAMAAAALTAVALQMKSHTEQDDFPPWPGPEGEKDPGKEDDCFKGVTAGIIYCNSLTGAKRAVCLAGVKILAVMCGVVHIFKPPRF
jgi:RHS repeat-associated protein